MRATHWAAAQSSKQILVSKYWLGKQRKEMEIFNITFLVHDIQNYFNSQEGLLLRGSSKPMFAVRFFRELTEHKRLQVAASQHTKRGREELPHVRGQRQRPRVPC